jgi:hypothetical protein
MQITIEARNAQELRDKVIDLGRVFGAALEINTPDPKQMSFPEEIVNPKVKGKKETVGADTPPLEMKEALKRAEEAAANEEGLISHSLPEEPAPEIKIPQPPKTEYPKATKEDARAALETLSEVKGMDFARNFLGTFSCKRLSELPEDQYPQFVHVCKQTAASN